MKFIVDKLPYYYEQCPICDFCSEYNSYCCPKTWNKYKVTENNPQECEHLIEYEHYVEINT